MYYNIQTPVKTIRISIKRLIFHHHDLGNITTYRAGYDKIETGGATEKAAYFKLLKLIIKKIE
jgi:methionine salvage enolase-phosphatase E1